MRRWWKSRKHPARIPRSTVVRAPDGTKVVILDARLGQHYEAAMTAFRTGKWDECISQLTRALDLDPAFAEGYFWKAAAHFVKAVGQQLHELDLDSVIRNCERAITDYSRAIELDPSSTKAYLNRSGVYYTLGREQDAVRDLMKAQQIDPKAIQGQNLVVSEGIRKVIDQRYK